MKLLKLLLILVLLVTVFIQIDAKKISADGTEITTKAPEVIQENAAESEGHIIGPKPVPKCANGEVFVRGKCKKLL
jgi:hypothetical protein